MDDHDDVNYALSYKYILITYYIFYKKQNIK